MTGRIVHPGEGLKPGEAKAHPAKTRFLNTLTIDTPAIQLVVDGPGILFAERKEYTAGPQAGLPLPQSGCSRAQPKQVAEKIVPKGKAALEYVFGAGGFLNGQSHKESCIGGEITTTLILAPRRSFSGGSREALRRALEHSSRPTDFSQLLSVLQELGADDFTLKVVRTQAESGSGQTVQEFAEEYLERGPSPQG